MFGLGRQRPAPPPTLTRQQQIDSLKAAYPHISEVPGDPNSWDLGLLLQEVRVVVRVRTSLPVGFPDMAPIVRIIVANNSATHPWLDGNQRVVGSPELNAWDKTKNLGVVLQTIIQYFGSSPPKLVGPAHPETPTPTPPGGAVATASPAPRPQPVPSQRPKIPIPPVPESFPELESLSLAELETLKVDAAERKTWMKGHESLAIFQALLSGQRERQLKAASSNLEKQAEIVRLQGQISEAEEALRLQRTELQGLRVRVGAALERYSPVKLTKDLLATARELEAMCDRLATEFKEDGGASSGGGKRGDSASQHSGGTADASGVREFRDEFLALRKRYHIARAKAMLLSQKGFVAAST